MLNWGLGVFVILHGVTHAFWPSYGTTESWLLGHARALSAVLWVAATALFAVAGLAILLEQSWWRPLAVVGAVESLVLLGLFWRRGLFVGPAIDVAILVALLWMQRPSPQVVGG
jgi:hypothetical protein